MHADFIVMLRLRGPIFLFSFQLHVVRSLKGWLPAPVFFPFRGRLLSDYFPQVFALGHPVYPQPNP